MVYIVLGDPVVNRRSRWLENRLMIRRREPCEGSPGCREVGIPAGIAIKLHYRLLISVDQL